MADAAINAVMSLLAGLAGIGATSPFAETGISRRPILETSQLETPGFELLIENADGGRAGILRTGRPVPVNLDKLPENFLNAVVAAEDLRFLEHPGVDPVGTVAALADTVRGEMRGGSGLAQQMVKNTITGPAPSLDRKATEAMLAVRMTSRLGRPEIMRRYLQSAWFGRGVHGVMPAPNAWFGKDWGDIDLAEAATLAAMLRGPALYDPWRHPERVTSRRDAIIDVMEAQGWVGAEEALSARTKSVQALAPPSHGATDPWILSATAPDLDRLPAGAPHRGLAVTSITTEWQSITATVLAESVRAVSPVRTAPGIEGAELALLQAMAADDDPDNDVLPREMYLELPAWSEYRSTLIVDGEPGHWDVLTAWGLERDVWIEDPHPDWTPSIGALVPALPVETRNDRHEMQVAIPTIVEAAAILMDPRNGEIIASVGGVDDGLGSFDRTMARRQPGSAIKPFLYLAALDRGYQAGTPVEDVERSYRSGGQWWRPRNYDHAQLGRIPMYQALERSLNVATVWIADLVGIDAMAAMAETAGVYPDGGMVRVLPSALGASETTLRRLTAGYAAIVNDAIPRTPHALRRIEGRDGTALAVPPESGQAPIASSSATTDILGMLRGVAVRGTAYKAFRDHPVSVAGKTGTTQDHRDAWFVGMTPHLAIGIWLGRDDNKPLPGSMTGGTSAAPIAAKILSRALEEGLLDETGYRDERLSSGITWPPALHDGYSSPGMIARDAAPATTATAAPAGNPVFERAEARSLQDSSLDDPFWGMRAAPSGRPDYERPDENADLLDF